MKNFKYTFSKARSNSAKQGKAKTRKAEHIYEGEKNIIYNLFVVY